MITSEEMAQLELRSEQHGVSCKTLMENSGQAAADVILERYAGAKSLLVLAYHGNNGGDGFVLARLLQDRYAVRVWFLGDEKKLKDHAKENFSRVDCLIETPDLSEYDILVDALLGTGASGSLREPLSSIIDAWDAASGVKIALDIPTGLNPDTGTHDTWLHPDLIITFHDTKPGLDSLKDKTIIKDIGVPEAACAR